MYFDILIGYCSAESLKFHVGGLVLFLGGEKNSSHADKSQRASRVIFKLSSYI